MDYSQQHWNMGAVRNGLLWAFPAARQTRGTNDWRIQHSQSDTRAALGYWRPGMLLPAREVLGLWGFWYKTWARGDALCLFWLKLDNVVFHFNFGRKGRNSSWKFLFIQHMCWSLSCSLHVYMCIYPSISICLWCWLCKQGEMSTLCIAMVVWASAVYSNLAISCKVEMFTLSTCQVWNLFCF